MAPQTKSYRKPKTQSNLPTPGPSFKARPTEQRDPSGLPGVSKIKASIRQTKRLLAKENVEPGLKIATERRLRSLEADLMKAERRGIEKKNGGKYHMVKFFERQKLIRIIRRLRKGVESSSTPSEALVGQLEEARVMLNYVLHYPNDKKYIALFPASSSASDGKDSKLTLPPLLSASTEDKTKMAKGERKRLEILLETRGMMERGELEAEPEKGLGNGEERVERVRIGSEKAVRDEVTQEKANGKSGKKAGKEDKPEVAEEDDFFESD